MDGSLPEERGDDLEGQFDAIMEGLRADVRRMRQEVARFGRGYQRQAERPGGDEHRPDIARAFRRYGQLQLTVDHIASSAAFLIGAGAQPADDRRLDSMDVAHRVLESLEAERERLYRDVHDGPAQVLANAMFEVEYLERVAERVPGELPATLRTELAGLKARLRSSLESVRAMIYDLRPPMLSELGLAGAMCDYATEYQARYGTAIACEVDETPTGLAPVQELAVYRVMQEALQNVHKHARAVAVRLAWGRTGDAWSMSCGDDGVGFDLLRPDRRRSSVGLIAMRERAELIGGSLHVLSSPGQGTTVRLELPMPREVS
ncbi:MAG: sensor histidine kinase [Chloroflexota bacterium]|nr:sensor histidine kinase [Chloroflexota bacterium]